VRRVTEDRTDHVEPGMGTNFQTGHLEPLSPKRISENHKIKQQMLESQNTTILYIYIYIRQW